MACYIPMKFLIYLHITSVCVYDAVVYITMYVVISIQETIIHDSFGGVCFCNNSHTTPICDPSLSVTRNDSELLENNEELYR